MNFLPPNLNYRQPQTIKNRNWVCGYCSHLVSSDKGYKIGVHDDGSGDQHGGVYICPNCRGATFISPDNFISPTPAMGNPVKHLPKEIDEVYEEARRCTKENCHTAAVLICRKILMNIAVNQGATANQSFMEYVNYLSNNGFVPPNGKLWVDHIRKKGNDATHEIVLMTSDDAKDILTFTEMLLKFIYEFPAMISADKNAG